MVKNWRFFVFSERHSFQRLTITWASRWQGILVQYFVNLILRVCKSVDFSKSILDRHPRSWRRAGDTWWRHGADFQEDIVKKWSKLLRFFSSAYLGPRCRVLEPSWRGGLTCGWGRGVVAQTPPSWDASWRNHLQRSENNPHYEQAPNRESPFQRFQMKSDWITNSQKAREEKAKHEPNIFLVLAEPMSSSDLTQKTSNYQRWYLSSQPPLSADVINLSDTSARRQAWQALTPLPPTPPTHPTTTTPPAHLWLYWWNRRAAMASFLTFSISPCLFFFSLASLLFLLIFCFWAHLFMKNLLLLFLLFSCYFPNLFSWKEKHFFCIFLPFLHFNDNRQTTKVLQSLLSKCVFEGNEVKWSFWTHFAYLFKINCLYFWMYIYLC